MNISFLPKRIEIAFWVAVIPFMKNSTGMQTFVRKMYSLYIFFDQILLKWRVLLSILAWSAIGLLLGFVLGLWVTVIW